MVKRQVAALVGQRLRRYPAVGLVGPRQVGKTTLARGLGGAYFDLEQEGDRLRLDLQWDELFAGRSLLVLDEAQAWPAIFPRLRGAIDAARGRVGRALLLGSVSPALMTQVSQSLAGRLSLVELTPFLAREVPTVPVTRLWCRGGFPEGGALQPRRFPQWQRDYLTLLAQRDLPAWGLPAKPQVTERLLRMVAALHGQPWNASQVGQGLGLSYHTVNGYLDYLEGAFLIRRLPAYQASLRKRLIKSPKVYWRDAGLLHALLNVGDENDLFGRPWVGLSWEGFVIEQILGALQATARPCETYYLRTSDQHEIDLVLDYGASRWAIEVKLTAAPDVGDLARLDKAADLIGADTRILVSQTIKPTASHRRISCNLAWLLAHLAKL
jgi:predicted AAA+ superfamily ATPase